MTKAVRSGSLESSIRHNNLSWSLFLALALVLANKTFEVGVGWHQTNEAHGCTISVNLDVDAPDADTFPALHLIYSSVPAPTPLTNVWARPENSAVHFDTSEYPKGVSGKTDKELEAVYGFTHAMDKAYAVVSDLTLGDDWSSHYYILEQYTSASIRAVPSSLRD